jgi:hypothetical protein
MGIKDCVLTLARCAATKRSSFRHETAGRGWSIGILLFIGAALVAAPAADCLAGQFQIEKGLGVEVCELYLKNLNSVQANPVSTRNFCPIPIDPSLQSLSAPAWDTDVS